MDDLIFYSMASGSSGNCYFIGNRQYGFLIDAGISARLMLKNLRAINVDVPQVRALFVTHIHKDHTQSMSVVGNRWKIPVFTTKKTFLEIDKASYIRKRVEYMNRHFLEHGDRIQLGDFFITSFFVPHDVDDNSGFVIEYKGKTVVLITDAGRLTQTILQTIGCANYLIIESNHDKEMLLNGSYPYDLKQRIASSQGHLSNDEAAYAVANYMNEDLRALFLCHLSESNNTPELAIKTMQRELIYHALSKAIKNPKFPIVALDRKEAQLFVLD